MKIKLIITDLDGTFLNDAGEIPVENSEIVKSIITNHPEMKVVFATGTGPERTMKYVQACGIDQQQEAYMICYNGGAIIKLSHGKQEVILRKALSVAEGQDVIKIAKKYDAELQIYDIQDKKVLWLEDVEKFNKLKLGEKQENIMQEDYLYKGLLIFKKENNKIDDIIKELKNNFPNFEISRSKLSKSHALFENNPNAFNTSIEINPKGADKGQAVKKLCEILNVSLVDEVLACGDEMNDFTMLQTVGCSVAVDNANPQIKSIAKFTTLSNNKAGFAEAVEKHVFEERKMLWKEFGEMIENYNTLFHEFQNIIECEYQIDLREDTNSNSLNY